MRILAKRPLAGNHQGNFNSFRPRIRRQPTEGTSQGAKPAQDCAPAIPEYEQRAALAGQFRLFATQIERGLSVDFRSVQRCLEMLSGVAA